jgi:hypothetical protein
MQAARAHSAASLYQTLLSEDGPDAPSQLSNREEASVQEAGEVG